MGMIRAAACGCLLLASPAVANWYGSIGAGLSEYGGVGVEMIDDGSFTNSMGQPTPSTEDAGGLALVVRAGLAVSESLAVEFSYADYGEAVVTGTSNGCCAWAAGTVRGSVSTVAIQATAALRLPLNRSWALIGSGGLALSRTNTERSDRFMAVSERDDAAGPAVSGGIEWAARKLAIRAEVGGLEADGRVGSAVVSAVFRP